MTPMPQCRTCSKVKKKPGVTTNGLKGLVKLEHVCFMSLPQGNHGEWLYGPWCLTVSENHRPP